MAAVLKCLTRLQALLSTDTEVSQGSLLSKETKAICLAFTAKEMTEAQLTSCKFISWVTHWYNVLLSVPLVKATVLSSWAIVKSPLTESVGLLLAQIGGPCRESGLQGAAGLVLPKRRRFYCLRPHSIETGSQTGGDPGLLFWYMWWPEQIQCNDSSVFPLPSSLFLQQSWMTQRLGKLLGKFSSLSIPVWPHLNS